MAKHPLSQIGEWEQKSPVVQTAPAFTNYWIMYCMRQGRVKEFYCLDFNRRKKGDQT